LYQQLEKERGQIAPQLCIIKFARARARVCVCVCVCVRESEKNKSYIN